MTTRRKGSYNEQRKYGRTQQRYIGMPPEIFGPRDDIEERQKSWESLNEKKREESNDAVAKAIAMLSKDKEYRRLMK